MDREDAIDWNNKGYSLSGEGRHLEAIDAYDHAIRLDPSNPIFQKNKERELSVLQRQKKSGVFNSNQKTRTKLEYAIDWNNRAGMLFKQGRIDEAILAYDRAISLDPTHPIFWKNKSKALKSVGRDPESETAHELFESIQTQKNRNPSEEAILLNNKGHSLAEIGNHIEAIEAYNRAINVHPTFADAYNNLGYSLAELGRVEEAITACYRAVELNPEFAYSWIEKWLFLPELVQNPENITPANEIANSVPEDPLMLSIPPTCNHASGLIEMEPVFTHSKINPTEFLFCGWVCPSCGLYLKK
jgi:tetratricopeptide (TPR) repeat protein